MSREKIIHEAIKEVLDNSTAIAYRDAMISQEEADLIEILANRLMNIELEITPLVDTLDDKLSDREIKSRIQLIARDIIPDLTETAQKDGIMSSEEFAIISKVLSTIM